jgi:hypothetical protein
LEDFVERCLMLIIGLIMTGGGIRIAQKSLDGQRAAFQLALVAVGMIIFGLYLCVWTFTGPPE